MNTNVASLECCWENVLSDIKETVAPVSNSIYKVTVNALIDLQVIQCRCYESITTTKLNYQNTCSIRTIYVYVYVYVYIYLLYFAWADQRVQQCCIYHKVSRGSYRTVVG